MSGEQEQQGEEELVLFLDSEGEPAHELAAICVDLVSLSVKDVYLQWAKPPFSTSDVDWFSRRHIHGLSRNFLQRHALENEEALIADFHSWRQKYTINEIFAHAPGKEEVLLDLTITDVMLPTWIERCKSLHHRSALCMKTLDMHVKDTACTRFDTHNEYKGWTKNCTEGDLARQEFGHHCALYDSVSILLYKFPDINLFAYSLCH